MVSSLPQSSNTDAQAHDGGRASSSPTTRQVACPCLNIRLRFKAGPDADAVGGLVQFEEDDIAMVSSRRENSHQAGKDLIPRRPSLFPSLFRFWLAENSSMSQSSTPASPRPLSSACNAQRQSMPSRGQLQLVQLDRSDSTLGAATHPLRPAKKHRLSVTRPAPRRRSLDLTMDLSFSCLAV